MLLGKAIPITPPSVHAAKYEPEKSSILRCGFNCLSSGIFAGGLREYPRRKAVAIALGSLYGIWNAALY